MFDMLPKFDKDGHFKRLFMKLGTAAFVSTQGVQKVRDCRSRVYGRGCVCT